MFICVRNFERLHRLVRLAVLLVLFFATSSSSFDGNRKGFVMGAGIGYAPALRMTSADVETGGAEDGLALSGHIGWAIGEDDLFTYGGTVTFGSVEIEGRTWDADNAYQGIHWFHYFGRVGHAVFTRVGAGLYHFYILKDGCRLDEGSGPAYSVGIGVEFLKQVQIGAYFLGGKSSLSLVDFGHSGLIIEATVTAY